MSVILTESVILPDFSRKEILRYAGCLNTSESIDALLDKCIERSRNCFAGKVCFGVFDLKIIGNVCDLGGMKIESADLSKNLADCDKAVIFGATVGVGIDRLIMKYSRIAPSEAVMYQAIGAERIESLCDAFCRKIGEEYGGTLKPRFSPGYGDLPLAVQRDIFSLLDCKKIGLSLNESLLMSPTKSVTAFVGIHK